VRPDGTVLVRMSKSGRIKACGLDRTTLATAVRLPVEGDERVLPGPLARRTFYVRWRKLLAVAGLEVSRRNGPQKLRRTSATFVEMLGVGRATAHLGHRSADLARRHYIDAGLAYEPVLPPTLPPATRLLEGPATERREAG